MGVVIRQSIKSSIVSVVSLLLGVISTLFIYTLDLDAYGFAQILLTTALLFAPIASFGMTGMLTRYFPYFKESEEGRASFFTLALVVGTVGTLFFGALGYTLVLPLLESASGPGNNIDLYITYAKPIFLLILLQVYIGIVDTYTLNFRRITVQTIVTSLLQKVVLITLVFLAYYYRLDNWLLAQGLIAGHVILLTALLLYLRSLNELRFSLKFRSYVNDDLKKDMQGYALYMIVGAIGGKLALEIDTVSLGAYVDTEQVGVYKIVVFAAATIGIPLVAACRILSPIVTQAIKDKDVAEIGMLYRRSAVVLSFVGVMTFTILLVSLQDIFKITGKEEVFVGGLTTFALIGLSQLANIFSSINHLIISYSKLYRFNIVLIPIMALSNVALNWLFIVKWELGMIGAAMATLFAIFMFNLMKSLYVYYRMKIHSLQVDMLYPIIIAAACSYFFLEVLPLSGSPLVNITLRSGIILLLFTVYSFYTPYLPEVKKNVLLAIEKLRNRAQ